MTPMMTTEEFKTKVANINPEYEVLSEYQGVRKPILRKCMVCGDVRQVQARALLDKRRCAVCAARHTQRDLSRPCPPKNHSGRDPKRRTHEQFVAEMGEINPNIEILSEFVSTSQKVKCRCLVDGHEWEACAASLLAKHGCPECGRKKNPIASLKRLTHDEYVEAIHAKFPHIDVTSTYCGTERRTSYRCNLCGYEWNAVANTLLNMSTVGCPRCAGKARVDEAILIERLAAAQPTLRYVSGYSDLAHKARFACNACGYEWEAWPTNILRRSKGCPRCSSSSGAQRIEAYLKQRDIAFDVEYRFEDCRCERPLPFDFYLPQDRIAIEYDGEQHFMPVRFGGGTPEQAIVKLQDTQLRDNIKTAYCIEHNINLIRIPYTDFDQVESILDEKIP